MRVRRNFCHRLSCMVGIGWLNFPKSWTHWQDYIAMKIPWIHTNFYKLDEFIAQLYDVTVLLRFGICRGNLLGRGLGLRAKTKKGKVSNARSAATHQPTRRRGTRTCNGLPRLSLSTNWMQTASRGWRDQDSLTVQGSAKRRGLGCVNYHPGSAWVYLSKQPRLFADLCSACPHVFFT